MGQQVLCQLIEDIGLVLAAVCAAEQGIDSRPFVLDDAGVMACRQEVGTELLGLFPEQTEFNEFIAGNAGIGRPAMDVGIDEVIDDVAPEDIAEIQGIMGNPQDRGDGFG